jgi:AraC-like DNA-binding protein
MIPSDNCSWRFDIFQLPTKEFNWHYHTEYEICLTLNSEGSIHIGDHVSDYNQENLVLLGPNLPHSWQATPITNKEKLTIYVAQIPAIWLDNLVRLNPELRVLSEMLTLSLRGIEYSQTTTKKSFALFQAMEKAEPLERYILLMQLFNLMVNDEKYKVLSSSFFTFSNKTDISVDKLDKVINYIYQNYTDVIRADELAIIAHMSTNHFHRFFKQRTEKTLNQFITQLRIGKACKLLINSSALVSAICDQCGFNNVSNFNRHFLMVKGITPTEFRESIKSPSPL